MSGSTSIENIDFSQNPWKGIISEVAAEEGVSQSAISQRVKRRHTRTIQLVMAKVAERKAIVSQFEQAVQRTEPGDDEPT